MNFDELESLFETAPRSWVDSSDFDDEHARENWLATLESDTACWLKRHGIIYAANRLRRWTAQIVELGGANTYRFLFMNNLSRVAAFSMNRSSVESLLERSLDIPEALPGEFLDYLAGKGCAPAREFRREYEGLSKEELILKLKDAERELAEIREAMNEFTREE